VEGNTFSLRKKAQQLHLLSDSSKHSVALESNFFPEKNVVGKYDVETNKKLFTLFSSFLNIFR
jgi:hypothetical protein